MMKYQFIGREPMITKGIGYTAPGDIIKPQDPAAILAAQGSSLFIPFKEKHPKKKEEPKPIIEEQ